MAESLAVSTQYTNVIDRQTSHDGMGCAYAYSIARQNLMKN